MVSALWFARTVADILDVAAQVSLLGKSSPPVRWYGVRVGPFHPRGAPVLHLNEMVLFDNLYQASSWRSDLQAHPFPGEGEGFSFTLLPGVMFLTRPSLGATELLPALQSLPCDMPSCECQRGGFLFPLRLSHCCCYCFVLPDFLMSLMPVACSFQGWPLPVSACVSHADGWAGGRGSGSLSLPSGVRSALLGH